MAKSSPDVPQLDADEHVHLAMQAIQRGQDYPAMAHLKQAIHVAPDNGLAHYLMAAQHAQLGMFERAEAGMRKALELAPDIMMAYLQLGMLLSARGETGEARQYFERLAGEPESDALHCFGKGLLALLDEDVDACEAKLKQGMQMNRSNPALNMDMQRVLAQLGRAADSADEKAAPVETGKPAEAAAATPEKKKTANGAKDANQLFRSIYGKGTKDSE